METPAPHELTIRYDDGEELTLTTAAGDELRAALNTVRERPTREIWLDSGRKGALSVLVSGDLSRAILIPMDEGGLHSVASDPGVENAPENVRFLLGNGQADEYSREWTVPLGDALSAIEYTFATGLLAPLIAWDDGSSGWGESDKLTAPDPRLAELINTLDSLETVDEEDELNRLQEVLDALERRRDTPRALFALFRVFERFPFDDGYGIFWGILHLLEVQPGYDAALRQSLGRRPTEWTLLMVNRILNSRPAPEEKTAWLGILQDIAADPRWGDSERLDAFQYYEKHDS